MLVGGLLIAAGFLLQFTNLGRLPGDIVIRRKNATFYFPLATSLLLSLGLTLLLWLLRRK
ncbi:MAG: DUF2905 domain-containing protein [Bryobacterales bacterium]|nr:DUF2905 domain-containing protein [Bryobacterales bacterium]